MTRKQTNSVLMLEGSYYAFMVIGLVTTIGIGITYGLFLIVKQSANYATFVLPTLEIIGSFGLIFVLCLFTPYIVMKSSEKKTLAERIKE